MRQDLPTGTVTFLFTDVEGSTRLLHELGADRYAAALAAHRRIVRQACAAHGGVEVDTEGDAFFVAFPTAPGALAAARAAAERLDGGPIRVRMGLHTGTPLVTPEGYIGGDVHRAARIAGAGHGGQILVSTSTAALVDCAELRDLGEHRLKDLSAPERLYQFGDAAFPPLKSLSRTNLPIPVTPFVGRAKELADVVELLKRPDLRLLSLTGPGGTGKSRLAAQAAASVSDDFAGGVYWVGLAAIREPAVVLEAIAESIGAKGDVADHIAEQKLLILLDNIEQVIAAAPSLSALVASCPELTLLVTSRELLRVHGEVEYAVPPLAASEAVSLFCERADLESSEEIAELCAGLDNLPLAVELAAARTKALSPRQILQRISQRLDLLKGGRDADPRQQTLWATVNWSYELLGDDEQRLFRALSVFAGGSTLEAAEEVAEAELDTLQSLVEKSLLRYTNERYWMLETIRSFATQQLGETEEHAAVRGRQAQWLESVVDRHSGIAGIVSGDSAVLAELFEELDAEHDNVRAVLAWLHESGDATTGLRLAGGVLAYFWWARGYIREGLTWLESFRSLPGERPSRLDAQALSRLAFLASYTDPSHAVEHAEAAVAMWREIGDDDELIRSLNGAGCACEANRRSADAVAYFDEALARAQEAGSEGWVITLSANKADALIELGELEAARSLLASALESARRSDSAALILTVLSALGVLDALEAHPAARDELREGLTIARAMGFSAVLPSLLGGFAALASERGKPGDAVVLASAAKELGTKLGEEEPSVLRACQRAISHAQHVLDPDEVWRLSERGSAIDPEEAFEIALSLS